MGNIPTLTDLVLLSLLAAVAFGLVCSGTHLLVDEPASLASAALAFCEAAATAAIACLVMSALLWAFA